MKRLILVLALVLAAPAGTADASNPTGPIFAVVQSAPGVLPRAELPNASGSLALPPYLATGPAAATQLALPELQSLWQRAGSAYGIPWQVLGAINKVESNFGGNMGPSSAGAVGWMQFMPSTWERWGLDANGDGVADPWNPDDAVFSAARYLAAAGGRADIGHAVFAYNHAQWYVNDVLQLAGLYGAQGVDSTFSLDRLQVTIDEARAAIDRARGGLRAARRRERRLNAVENRFLAAAESSPQLSDRLAARKQAVQLDVRRARVHAEVERLQAELEAARASLVSARQLSAAPLFGTSFPATLAAGNYVFPVGGGPELVSVGHMHHDYPAADIAAPEGSPVYALADAVVERAWTAPDPACGIGLTLRTGDGLTWTYCHLQLLESAVQNGAILSAGTPVGLVGHTGDATGPHLHLQLQPATSYPQNQSWFQGYAGTAFTWQDAPAPAPTGRVFAVVQDAPQEPTGSAIAFTR